MRIEKPASEYLSEIGKRGGSVRSERKAQQSRINGARNTGQKKMKKLVDNPSGFGVEVSQK